MQVLRRTLVFLAAVLPLQRLRAAQQAEAFAIGSVRIDREKSARDYLQFLKVPSMRMGLYALAAGAEDRQTPHQEDEVYFVTKGRAILRVESREFPVEAGSMVFVPAHAAHKFHDITEAFETVVFFSATPPSGDRH